MTSNSLAFRLFATAAAWTLVVLPIAGFIIYSLYRKEMLDSHDRRIKLLLTLVRQDSVDHGGSEPGAPKDTGERLFEILESGWYWQIKPLDNKPGRKLVSDSLATEALPLPSEAGIPPNDEELRWAIVNGPGGQKLRVAEVVHLFGEDKQAQPYSVAVAGTLGEPEVTITAFRTRLTSALALAGLGLLAVTLFQVRFGLYPLRRVERSLAAIRTGDADRLDGELPDEIQPLQQELNALLKSNQEIIERARTQVGNLAHALKTPLAVLVNEAREDKSPLSAKVTEQAEVMRTQVNHYLDRARVAARVGVIGRITEVQAVGESIARALERIYREKDLAFTIDCAPNTRFQGEKQDLEEILGNLLDNAAKWASAKVRLTATVVAESTEKTAKPMVVIRVEDDGPGLTDEQLAEPVKRGRRLDESKPGSGLGQSIVADLAHSYRGKLALSRSGLGGLCVTVTLPAA
jgi:signal transduction histidine kinase